MDWLFIKIFLYFFGVYSKSKVLCKNVKMTKLLWQCNLSISNKRSSNLKFTNSYFKEKKNGVSHLSIIINLEGIRDFKK